MSILERGFERNASVNKQSEAENERAALTALIDYVVEKTAENQKAFASRDVENIRNNLSSILSAN